MTIKIRWVSHTTPPAPIVWDTNNSCLVEDIMEYAIYLQDKEHCSFEYVRNELHHLSLFYKYINQNHFYVRDVTSEILKNFRDYDLSRLKAKSPASERKLKRVVNNHLSRIYNYYHWFQKHHKLENLIGASQCAITSEPTKKTNKRSLIQNYALAYPLNFRRIGRGSKHATEHSATEEEVAKLDAHFRNTEDMFVSERNSLIMAIANTVGFRRASINSLRCGQFSEENLKTTLDDYIVIKPDEQKFDANISYKLPILLAYRISDFIKNIRNKWILEHRIMDEVTLDRIFLSSRNGRPLNHATISNIFGKAFKAIGSSQPRTSIHSLRRKFACDDIIKNFEQRVELKLDVSDASISAAVSMNLGHSDPESLRPYISRIQQQMVNRLHEQKNEVVRKLFEENMRLKIEIESLKALIKNST